MTYKNYRQDTDDNFLANIYSKPSDLECFKSHILFKLFSFLLPILGFFLYLSYKPYNRYNAYSILSWAICGIIIWIIIYIAAIFLGILLCL